MKKYFLAAFIPLITFMFLAINLPTHVAAFNPFDGSVCNQTDADGNVSPVCNADGTKNPITGTDGVITRIANIFALITGVAAVIVIIVGGFEYVRSGGDSAKVNKAKNTILFAIIGLVVVISARSAVALMVSKL